MIAVAVTPAPAALIAVIASARLPVPPTVMLVVVPSALVNVRAEPRLKASVVFVQFWPVTTEWAAASWLTVKVSEPGVAPAVVLAVTVAESLVALTGAQLEVWVRAAAALCSAAKEELTSR